jgi:hypothetical protein
MWSYGARKVPKEESEKTCQSLKRLVSVLNAEPIAVRVLARMPHVDLKNFALKRRLSKRRKTMGRTDNRLINIQFTDGRVTRIPRPEAAVKVDSGEAKYISNTIYRGLRPRKVSKAEIAEQQQEKAAQRRKNKNLDIKS